MTKEAALFNFYSSFGLPVHEENSVPTGDSAPKFPYITYELVTDDFGGEIALTASLWYRSESLVKINSKTKEISTAIGRGGIFLPCDGGAIWIKRGTPFAQSMGDESDKLVKRKLLNLTAEFVTAD